MDTANLLRNVNLFLKILWKGKKGH